MQVRQFEDLIAWQKARALAAAIYTATRSGGFTRDAGLASQLQRAAVSVMANIAEGFERRRPLEFARFLDIAGASNAEVRSHLYVALDVGYLEAVAHAELSEQSREVGRVIAGLRRSVLRDQPGPGLRELPGAFDPDGLVAFEHTPSSRELGTRNWELVPEGQP